MSFSRFDTYKITEKAVKLDSGFLRVPVFATRAGVFSYRRADGSVRRELRHPDEVFKADSLQTLAGVPLTNRHPSVLVDSKNVKKYIVGTVSDLVERQDMFVKTSTTVMDAKVIDEVENKGLREVSCGYKCDVEETPGVWEGEHYDAIQTNIRYNHLAIVDRGRAGPEVKLRMDEAELVEDGESDPNHKHNPNGGRTMLVKIDGVEFEADNSLASAITQALEKRDSALAGKDKEIATLKTDSQKKADELQAKFDQLESDNKKLKEDAANAPDVNELVKARVSLVEAAKPHLDKETIEKIDSMDDKAVKLAVISAKVEKFDSEGKSDDYINARFDAIVEMPVEAKNNSKTTKLDKALSNVDGSRKDGEERTAEQIRADRMKEDAELWKKPLSNKGGE